MKRKLTLLLSIILILSSINNGYAIENKSNINYYTDQVLRVNWGWKPLTLDPQFNETDVNLINAITEGLVRLDKDGRITEGIAKKWDISSDGLTYTFYLRDAEWSDGSSITAYDFEYSWKRALNPEVILEYSFMFYDIKNAYNYNMGETTAEEVGIEALNDKTLVVTLEKPSSHFIKMLASTIYRPSKQDMAEKLGEDYGNESDNIVYSGPFKVVKWNHYEEIILERNPYYWDIENVTLQRIEGKLTYNQSDLKYYNKGELDNIKLEDNNIEKYKDSMEFSEMTKGSIYFLTLNCRDEFLSNKKIRKALSIGLNREDYYNEYLNREWGFVPQGILGKSLKTFREESGKVLYDVGSHGQEAIDEANRLLNEGLTELGITKEELSNHLVYLTGDSDSSLYYAERLQEIWYNNLGIKISIEQNDFSSRLFKVNRGEFTITGSGWIGDYNDPYGYLSIYKSDSDFNNSRWSNTKFDLLLEQSEKNYGDERIDYLLEAERILLDEVPEIPYGSRNNSYLTKEYVKDLIRYPELTSLPTEEYKWVYIDKGNEELVGDFNNDSRIDMIDIRMLMDSYGKDIEYGIDSKFDLNSDGKIDVKDVIKLYHILSELIY